MRGPDARRRAGRTTDAVPDGRSGGARRSGGERQRRVGGVRALDIRGDLSTCTADQKSPDGRCDLKKMGRELAAGLQSVTNAYVWGVHFDGNFVYASDMNSGLFKLAAADR